MMCTSISVALLGSLLKFVLIIQWSLLTDLATSNPRYLIRKQIITRQIVTTPHMMTVKGICIPAPTLRIFHSSIDQQSTLNKIKFRESCRIFITCCEEQNEQSKSAYR
ncbi:hypothetical protein PGTUg99_034023 [Puccinia graminis f. sp. tritici]|uniref:Uncharacterized protein n=1 Tax=Puccinia graminis f. sp. tritici TaxID=56615 RepID=A0A5B0MZL9_PUCGR|nr:hypothetical protein PGTUg99_034023 [Puccinia graminis f. sp. tritici]